MTALRSWAAVGVVALVIGWGWYAAERLVGRWELRRAERAAARRYQLDRLERRRP